MEQAIYWLAGAVGVPLITWLKGQFDLSGKAAVWLALAVSALLAVAALFLSQELTLADFTPQNLLAALGQVLAAATLAYKLLTEE
jgi:hypothetical protein